MRMPKKKIMMKKRKKKKKKMMMKKTIEGKRREMEEKISFGWC